MAPRISPHPHRGHGAAAARCRDAAGRGPAAGHRRGDGALDLLDHALGRPARRADRAGTRLAAADLPRLALAAQGNATALSRSCSTHRPAACRRGTRSAARCPASSSPCRQTGAAEQPGGSNRQLGRSEVRDNIERGIRRSSRAIQAPELTRQRLHAIRHRTYPPWHPEGPRTQQQRRLPRRAPLALACPQDFADTGQRSAGPRPGGPDPPPNTGQDPADQRQHQDPKQPPTKSHGQEHDPRLPDQRPATPRPHPQRHLSHA